MLDMTMLDIMGAMALTSIAALVVGTLTVMGTPESRTRGRIVALAAGWFVVIAGLAAGGVFARPGIGFVALGAAVATPIAAGLLAGSRSQAFRDFVVRIPLGVLVAVHVGRLLGGFFVALHGAGRLPPTFALTAGWGDILVAALALPLAWAIHRRLPRWRSLALAWNAVGLLDLIVAVTLGVGSADSPARFLFEHPDAGPVTALPWSMIPGFLVPMYVLVHVAIFARLAAAATSAQRPPMRSTA